MNLDDSDKAIIAEAKRSHEISTNLIKSYDTKIHQIIVLTTASLSVIFIIASFFGLEYHSEHITKNIILYFGYFTSLTAVLICLIFSLVLCLKTYTISKYSIISPIRLWRGLSSCKSKQKFMNDLIEEIDYNTNKNSQILKNLWDYYTKSIAYLTIGIVLIILFIIFAILIKISI